MYSTDGCIQVAGGRHGLMRTKTRKTLTVKVILIFQLCKTDVFGNLTFVAEFALAFLALQTSAIVSVLGFNWRFRQHITIILVRLTGKLVRPRYICLGFLSRSLWSTSFSLYDLYKKM